MSAEFMVICKKILSGNYVIVSLFVFTCNTWAQYNNNIKIVCRYESKGKCIVRDSVKDEAIVLELAKIYVRNRYGQDTVEEEKPYGITELTTSWVIKGTIYSDQIAGGVFVIEISKNDRGILNFGHGKQICKDNQASCALTAE